VSLLDTDADADAGTVALDLARWTCPITGADDSVLARAAGPVLDVGCGPGRHVRALTRRGVFALGLDASPEAVRVARAHGTEVLHGSIFDELPGAGSWGTALLLDGSIGIGGHPVALLRRVAELLVPGGAILVEGEPPGTPTRSVRARVHAGAGHGPSFPWALVGSHDLAALGRAAGLRRARSWTEGGRWFAELA
jgi:SAM-dependent methyltransferase